MKHETPEPTRTSMVLRGLVLFPSRPVELSYQNFGSTLLCILRGSTENVEAAFNGFHNLSGTNGEMQWFDHAQTVGIFWSNWRGLRRFFFNLYFLRHIGQVNHSVKSQAYRIHRRRLVRQSMKFALQQLSTLRENYHETIMRFADRIDTDNYSCGTMTAERPDYDGKDLILINAHTDKTPE